MIPKAEQIAKRFFVGRVVNWNRKRNKDSQEDAMSKIKINCLIWTKISYFSHNEAAGNYFEETNSAKVKNHINNILTSTFALSNNILELQHFSNAKTCTITSITIRNTNTYISFSDCYEIICPISTHTNFSLTVPKPSDCVGLTLILSLMLLLKFFYNQRFVFRRYPSKQLDLLS